MNDRIPPEQIYSFVREGLGKTWFADAEPKYDPAISPYMYFELKDGDWYFHDEFLPTLQTTGRTTVKYKGQIVWAMNYVGGLMEGKESLKDDCYKFLKQAVMAKEEGFDSLRGPHSYTSEDGKWQYAYTQTGTVASFHGLEEIRYEGEVVFYHKTQGVSVIYES
ncbi:MAG: hypothetical protein JNK26_00475 [Candidatus Doudnabacteria bacterium]|nr:hypothetical protein [Candidatus Doudnabacteria bacterium]